MAAVCPNCNKTVFFAEEVRAIGKSWHKRCLKCAQCNKALNPGKIDEDPTENDTKVKIAMRLSLVANVLLFCMQLTGAIYSHSLSLISTTIDAFMDLLSNSILFARDYYRKKKNKMLTCTQWENHVWNLLELFYLLF